MLDSSRPLPSEYPMALTFRHYLKTHPGEDLAAAAAQLSAELAAKNVALLRARHGEPEAAQPRTHYERDSSFEGEYSEPVVSLPDHHALAAFNAESSEKRRRGKRRRVGS